MGFRVAFRVWSLGFDLGLLGALLRASRRV